MIHNDTLKQMDSDPNFNLVHCYGATLGSFPDGCDSSRLAMYAQNVKQSLVLLNPEFPHIFNGYENHIGKHNRGAYKELMGTWVVKDIITKFDDVDRKNNIYTMVLYNESKRMWEMIEKSPAENLTEKFGYAYNTDFMDSLEIDDVITDAILYKSTSYDDDMNYRTGINVLCQYTTDPTTMEDAIRVSESVAKRFQFVEVDNPIFTINGNDIPLNMYGDDEEYRAFPKIGEKLKDCIVCSTRQVHNENIFFDMLSDNLRQTTSVDRSFVSSKDAIVYDFDIFCNNVDGLPDTAFYRQLKGYHEMIKSYQEKIKTWCKAIKKSGDKYTSNIPFLLSIADKFNDPEYKFVLKDREFDNCAISVKTMAIKHVQKGCKLVGRYGDKGIVAGINKDTYDEFPMEARVAIINALFPDGEEYDIMKSDKWDLLDKFELVPDDLMPYTESGERIGIQFNGMGAFRRLNTDQLVENELNHIQKRIIEMMKTYLPDDYDKAEVLAFQYIDMVNENQGRFLHERYNSYDKTIKIKRTEKSDEKFINPISGNSVSLRITDKESQKAFIDEIAEKGFFIHKPPHSNMRYPLIDKIYNEFPWIKPYRLYVNKFGMVKKVIEQSTMGEKHVMLLKQTTEKNFSARSTSRVNRKNLPEKSPDKKNNRVTHSKNPIRIGEIYNLLATASPRLLAEYNIYLRSSPLGRHSLKRILEASDNPLNITKLTVKDSYTNTNASIARSYLKCLGLDLYPIYDNRYEAKSSIEMVEPLNIIGNCVVWDYPSNLTEYRKFIHKKQEFLDIEGVVEPYEGYAEDLAWSYALLDKELRNHKLYSSMLSMVITNMTDPTVFYEMAEANEADKKIMKEYEKACKLRKKLEKENLKKKAEEAKKEEENENTNSEILLENFEFDEEEDLMEGDDE